MKTIFKLLRTIGACVAGTLLCACGGKQAAIYNVEVADIAGQTVSLSQYKGKVILVVNSATQCGFTPQYEALQQLYADHRADGLEILDFPCNQFGGQAPGTIGEIHAFCTGTYDISFPQFDLIEVNGSAEHPLYTLLKKEKGFEGFDLNDRMGALLDGMLRKQDPAYDQKSDIKWNFTKFLIDRKGHIVARFEPTVPMERVREAVEKALKQ